MPNKKNYPVTDIPHISSEEADKRMNALVCDKCGGSLFGFYIRRIQKGKKDKRYCAKCVYIDEEEKPISS